MPEIELGIFVCVCMYVYTIYYIHIISDIFVSIYT